MKITLLSLILCSLGVTCAIFAGFIATQIIGEVNRKLPEDQQFQYFWFPPGKMQRISAQYRRLYPEGRLNFWRWALGLIGIALFLVGAISTGMFTS